MQSSHRCHCENGGIPSLRRRSGRRCRSSKVFFQAAARERLPCSDQKRTASERIVCSLSNQAEDCTPAHEGGLA